MSSAPGATTSEQRAAIEGRLDTFFADGRSRAERYGPEFVRLWDLTRRTAQGGKLVRPLLLLNLLRALRGSSPAVVHDEDAVAADLATGLELLHYAFLLHDDVIDGDLLRRGSPNLIGVLLDESGHNDPFRSLHWAKTGGVLMGDLLLAACHQIFARADLPDGQRVRLLDLLGHSVTESAAGEFTDVSLGDRITDPELSTVLAMSSRKTATYSFELPMRMAAVLGAAPRSVEDRVGDIGRHLGLGFQLQDDLLCAFGDAASHGKDAFSDLREGKQTLIIAFARSTEAWPAIELLLGHRDLTPAETRTISDLLTQCGARKFVEDMVAMELRSARTLVQGDDAALTEPVRMVLLRLITELEGRAS